MAFKAKFWLGLDFGSRFDKVVVKWADLLLRVGVSLLMLRHGVDKLFNFADMAPHFVDPLGVGPVFSLFLVVGSEFFGAAFLLCGFLTRWSAFSLFFTMMVAAFIVHGADPFPKKELALIYALIFLYFMIVGGGSMSLDHSLQKKLK